MNNEQLEFLIEKVNEGWHFVPGATNTKKPIKGFNWSTISISTEADVRKYFTNNNYNVAVHCARSFDTGVFIVDIDINKETGELSPFTITYENGEVLELPLDHELLNTFTVKTRSGGYHFYYKINPNEPSPTGTNYFCAGVDVRGTGGIAWCPPSSIDGKFYEVVKDVPIKEMPVEFIRFFGEKRAEKKRKDIERRNNNVEATHLDQQKAVLAIEHIPLPLSYNEWLGCYMALDSLFDEEQTLDIMDDWCKREGVPFTQVDVNKIYGFSADSKYTVATLIDFAKTKGNFDVNAELRRQQQNSQQQYWAERFKNSNSGTGGNESTGEETSVTTAPSVTLPTTEIGKLYHPFIVELGKNPTEVIDNFLKVYEVSDIGNAYCVYDLYGDVFRNVPGMGLLYYNGKYWDSESADSYLQEAVVNTLVIRNSVAPHHIDSQKLRGKTTGNSANINNAKTLFTGLVEIQDKVDNYNSYNTYHLLNCNNGVVNLKTGEVSPHSPTYKFTYCVPVDYDPNAKSEVFDKWLSDVVGHYELPEVRDYLQMLVGYTMSGYTYEECLFYFFGPSRSGKGTFITIFSELLGNLAFGTGFNTFTKKRDGSDQGFDYAPMWDKRLISASESGKSDTMNESAVKTITGRDAIRASFKGKDHFSFMPKFKIWVSSNNPPKGDVDDDAFWGRLRLIVFPNSYLGNEDKKLKDRLLQPEVLKAVLAYAVYGAIMYFSSDNGLNVPQVYKDALQQKRDEQDIVNQFLADEGYIITGDENDSINRKELYNEFENWCVENSVRPWAAKTFNASLAKKGCPHIDKQRKTMKSKIRCITGITKNLEIHETTDF